MLYEADRHEPLSSVAWNEEAVRDAIDAIVLDALTRYSSAHLWPPHPKDLEAGEDPAQPALPMYHGAAGMIWALHYLQDIGATHHRKRFDDQLGSLLDAVQQWAGSLPGDESASYLAGVTPLLMMARDVDPAETHRARLAHLIERNIEHPARELMWGSPGTMLAALHSFERFDEPIWRALFLRCAQKLFTQLRWSDEVGCHYWTQELYGRESSYLDAVHGFVATAFVLSRGRELFTAGEWTQWEEVITQTITRAAIREAGGANWPVWLDKASSTKPSPMLMQFCHGSPGFVICLADVPTSALDEVLVEAGEATWKAGPLVKGSNLCHGTGGNGYAFLKLFERTGDERWLTRARAFAMHGIEQMRDEERRYGQMRYSLWTGDVGFAIYLWDCVRARPQFPTLDVFFAAQASAPARTP